MMQFSLYHIFLRIGMMVIAVVLVFQSGLLSGATTILSHNTQLYLANSVGVSLGVAPTDLNKITAQLTEQRQQLDAREAAITEREIEIGLQSGSSVDSTTTFILSAMLFILLCLIVLNYILDFARYERTRKKLSTSQVGYALE